MLKRSDLLPASLLGPAVRLTVDERKLLLRLARAGGTFPWPRLRRDAFHFGRLLELGLARFTATQYARGKNAVRLYVVTAAGAERAARIRRS